MYKPVETDKPDDKHPGHVPGATTTIKVAVKEGTRLRIPLFYTVKDACIEALQEDRDVWQEKNTKQINREARREQDNAKGLTPGKYPELIKADPPGSGQLKAQGMRCRTCVFFVPCAFVAPPEPPKRADGLSTGRCISIALGHCHRRAPGCSGASERAVWPAIYDVRPGCGEYEAKV